MKSKDAQLFEPAHAQTRIGRRLSRRERECCHNQKHKQFIALIADRRVKHQIIESTKTYLPSTTFTTSFALNICGNTTGGARPAP